jgi:oligopeptide/dipeptide ABC transporter ATP-binding protein
MTEPLLRASGLRKHFRLGGSALRPKLLKAVEDVSFTIAPGETLGLVGESGSGKSTLGRVVVGLTPATAGRTVIGGQMVDATDARARRALWRQAQMVFQDPYSSLNPRMTVRDTLAEPLRNFGIARGDEAARRIREAMEACGLPANALDRYPSEFSGGQRQRIGIARALIVRPAFIVADEPVSALDVSIQAQVINLMQDLKAAYGLTYLFIAHDLAVVRHVSDRVAVMYRGRIVEIGPAAGLYARPQHPYTQLLMRSVPIPDPVLEAARLRDLPETGGELAAPPHGGCAFAPRCPIARLPVCAEEEPVLAGADPVHQIACHFAEHRRSLPDGHRTMPPPRAAAAMPLGTTP